MARTTPYHSILWALCLLMGAYLPAQSPVFRQHQPEDWGQVKIQVMYQDVRGWFWFGTTEGLFRYDGLAYDYFTVADTSLVDHGGIKAVFEKNDTIWAGFNNGMIAFCPHPGTVAEGHLYRWEPEEGTPQVPITGFAADPAGNLWIATYGEGLYVFNGKRLFQFNHADDGLSSDDIYTIICDAQGKVWVGTDNGISICQFSKNNTKSIQLLDESNGLPDEIVTALTCDKTGNIWIGTQDKGIAVYAPETGKIATPFNPVEVGEIWGIAVYDGFEVWATTSEAGLVRGDLSTHVLAPVEVNLPLSPFRIKRLLNDREGQLWILSDRGAVLSANLQVLPFQKNADAVQAICADRSGILWAGTQNGLQFKNNQGWNTASTGKINVISLAEGANGTIWAGTFGDGIYLLNAQGKIQKRLSVAQGLPNGSILSMAVQGDKMWVSTLGGVVYVDGTTFQVTNLAQMSGIAEAAKYYVYKIFADSKGRVWLCTDGHGLCMLANGTLKCFENIENVPLKTIYSITEDQHGTIWFSGDHTSLLSWDGQQFRRYTTKDHLHSNQINSLSMTGHGQLIIGYNDGVDIMTPSSGHVVFLSESSGIHIEETILNAADCDPSGHIWLGTNKGVVRVAGFSQMFAIDPGVFIRAVSSAEGQVNTTEYHRFDWNDNLLTFEFTGIWQTNPGSVIYRYKLEGFDPDWTISKDRIASYPNLPPGNYRFVVQATEHRSFDNAPEAVYSFTIRRPFWVQWWFVLGFILIVGALVRTWIKSRERRIQREQEMENEKMAAQLDVLKTQINPHFLFNSFNTLIAIIEENPALAVDYVQHLSDFYRSIMVYREKDFIPLQEELEMVENFGFLLKKRFEEALYIQISDRETPGVIMPLTLQMLLENAVKHNVISRSKPLTIDIFVENNEWIVVQNNINPKIKPEPGTRFGLQNLAHRYLVMTNKKIKQNTDNGFFTVKIPLAQEMDTHSKQVKKPNNL